jgi:hypothetical protein
VELQDELNLLASPEPPRLAGKSNAATEAQNIGVSWLRDSKEYFEVFAQRRGTFVILTGTPDSLPVSAIEIYL